MSHKGGYGAFRYCVLCTVRILNDKRHYHATTLDSVSGLFEGEIRNR
jgi:hypothetical protein